MVDKVPAGDNNKKQEEQLARVLSERGEAQTLEALNSERNAPQPTQDQEPVQADQDLSNPVTAGTRNYGGDATSSQEQNRIIETLAQNNMPAPQDQLNQDRAADNVYVAGTASEISQWNAGQSGSNQNIAGIASVDQKKTLDIEVKRQKELDAFMLLTGSQTLAAQFERFLKNFDQAKADVAQTGVELDDVTLAAREALNELNEKIAELTEEREIQQKEVERLEQDLKNATTPEEIEMAQAALDNAQAYLDATDSKLAILNIAGKGIEESLKEASDSYALNKRQISELEQQKHDLLKSGDASQEDIDALDRQLNTLNDSLAKTQSHIQDLQKQVESGMILSELTDKTRRRPSACFATADGYGKDTAAVLAEKAITDYTQEALLNDGTFTVDEVSKIISLAKDANIDITDIEKLAVTAADSGLITRTNENGEKVRVTSDEVLASLHKEWHALDAEHKDLSAQERKVEAAVSETETELQKLERETAELEKAIAAGDLKLSDLNAELAREQAETAQMLADQQKLEASWGEHTSVRGFMWKNYSINGALGGEKIDEISKDENRYIRDNGGNIVYMNTDSTLFTLKKETNPDGSVKLDEKGFPVLARDENGEQIRVPVPIEDEAALRAKLFTEKKLFGNFMNDNTAKQVVGESADGLGKWTTAFSSLFGMSKTAQDRIMADYLSEQKKQQEAAAQARSNAEAEINQTRSEIAQTQAEQDKLKAALAAKQARLSEIRTEKADVAEKRDAVGEKIKEHGGEVTDLKLDTPKYTPEQAAEWKTKLDSVSSITPEGIERLKAEAELYGFTPAHVENTLAANKVEIKDNIYADAQPQQVASAAQTSAPIVYYPLIGASAPRNEISPFIAKPETGGVAGGVKFGSVLDEYPQYNDPKNPNATYLAQINNKTDNAPVAAQSFNNALLATQTPDAARLATEADQRRLDQERLDQELMRQRLMAATGGGIGMSSTTGGAQGA